MAITPLGADAGELTGVPADLLRRIAVHANEFQVGLRGDALDHLGTDVAGGDLEDADRRGAFISTFQPSLLRCCVRFGGAAAAAVGIELLGPLANRGEALVLGGGQRGRIRIALVLPDVDVLLELRG